MKSQIVPVIIHMQHPEGQMFMSPGKTGVNPLRQGGHDVLLRHAPDFHLDRDGSAGGRHLPIRRQIPIPGGSSAQYRKLAGEPGDCGTKTVIVKPTLEFQYDL